MVLDGVRLWLWVRFDVVGLDIDCEIAPDVSVVSE